LELSYGRPPNTVVEELQEQLLAQEEELNNRKGIVVTWEDGLSTAKCAIGQACVEHDVKHALTESIRQNYLTSFKHSINFNWILEER
jgi:hypothetical protein